MADRRHRQQRAPIDPELLRRMAEPDPPPALGVMFRKDGQVSTFVGDKREVLTAGSQDKNVTFLKRREEGEGEGEKWTSKA